MPVDKKLVEKISKLSRLNIDKSKINDFVSNFEEILNYIDLLEQVPNNSNQNQEDLTSDYAKFVTGSIFTVDGGQTKVF